VTASAATCDEADPGWLLCEDFEDGGLGWNDWYAQSPWVECDGCPGGTNDPDRIRLEQDAAVAHDGEWSLHMPGTGEDYLGGTLRFATCAGEQQQAGCTLEGHDRLYFRVWTRLAADHDYVHHFLGLGGSRPDAYWEANGNAGCRPNGERWAGTRVDLDSNHELFFYTYHPGMSCDSGGYCSGEYAQSICDGCASLGMACENGPECCWGNHFSPEPAVVVPTEEWTCIEMMMQLNTPGEADGSMAFWVNDALAHEVTGMHWRDIEELQLNRAMLEHYIESGDTEHPNRVWFDDVVVSENPIGCSVGGPGGSSGDSGDTTGPATDDGGADAADQTAGNDATTGSGGALDGTGGTSAGTGTGGSGTGGGGADGGDEGADVGCSCRASDDRGMGGLMWALLALLALPRRRRRRAIGLTALAASFLATRRGHG
jgi:MYXO-CTERM domain-containing protein